MTEQSLLKKFSSAPSSSTVPIIDNLLDLTTSTTVDMVLEKSLRMAIKLLRAEAGSILFKAQSVKTIQTGVFRHDALPRIKRWEDKVRQRLTDDTWHISNNASPISVFTLANKPLTLVNSPLLQNTKVVGLLSLVLSPGKEITLRQRNLLSKMGQGLGQFASQFSEQELARDQLNRLSIFHDVGQALMTTFDINQLLLNAMELTTRLIDTGAASILLVDEDQNELVFRVSHGARSEMLRQQRIPITEGIAGWVVRHGRPVIANDARSDTRFSHRVDVRTGFLTQSIAAVPLKAKGRVIGVLEVLNKYSDHGFGQADVQLMSFIAIQVAIALENARVYNQLKAERDEIIQAQENSWKKITGTLNDSTLQYLSAISLSLDNLNTLSRKTSPDVLQNQIAALQNMVQQATRSTRNLLFEFYPPLLKTQGLVSACTQYINQLRTTGSCNIHFDTEQHLNFNPATAKVIFSIIHESIDNILHHANAHNIWLSLNVKRDDFIATIRDDGQGFNPQAPNYGADGKHTLLGILRMKEQAAAVNGNLKISSSTQPPNQGTTIQFRLPYFNGVPKDQQNV